MKFFKIVPFCHFFNYKNIIYFKMGVELDEKLNKMLYSGLWTRFWAYVWDFLLIPPWFWNFMLCPHAGPMCDDNVVVVVIIVGPRK